MIDIIIGILLILGISLDLYALGWVLLIFGLYHILMRYFGYKIKKFFESKANELKNGKSKKL